MIFDLLEKNIFSTMIFITHELPLLRHVAHNIAIMYAGEFVEYGTAVQVVHDPRHPYTKALMGAMLSADANQKNKKPTTIEGAPPSLAKKNRRLPFCGALPKCKAGMQAQKSKFAYGR